MKVLKFEKPKDEAPDLKGFRIIETTHMGLTHFRLEKKVYGFFWKALYYKPPERGQFFPLLFDQQHLALEFLKNFVAKENGSKVAWKG